MIFPLEEERERLKIKIFCCVNIQKHTPSSFCSKTVLLGGGGGILNNLILKFVSVVKSKNRTA